MLVNHLETPALIVEEKTFRKNAETMKALLAGTNLALRPHYKSHKCAAIARMQIADGAKGMTCAKLSEALDLADAGIEDILIANQIVEEKKIRRLAQLACDCRLSVCVDNLQNIAALSRAAKETGATIHCLVEYDIGMERCGVTNIPEVIALAEAIGSESHLHFEGIQAYAGHLSHVVDPAERKEKTSVNYQNLRELIAALRKKNMHVTTISGGSTGTALIKAAEGLYTELQAGSYLFMDATYAGLGLPFENSLFVLSTVVSRRDNLTIVDAGVKTCGVDQGMPVVCGGTTHEIVASEEHFQLHGLSFDAVCGDKLFLIPGHCCSTINSHDKLYIVDDGRVIDRIAVTGRGCGK